MNAQERIEEIYTDFLDNNTIDGISVCDICKKANINRTTFYKHFTSISDLRKKLVSKYTDEFVKDIVGEKVITSYTDFNEIVTRYIKFMEDKMHYVKMGVLEKHFHEYVQSFTDSLFQAFYEKMDIPVTRNGSFEKEMVSFNITYTIMSWSMMFVYITDFRFDIPQNRENVVEKYVSNLANLIIDTTNPYAYIHPDKTDIIIAMADYGLIEGKSFKNVSQLCKFTGISRQAFYRQYKNLEDCKDRVKKFCEIYVAGFMAKYAFEEKFSTSVFSKRKAHFTKEQADLKGVFMIDKWILDSINGGIFDLYCVCLKLLDKELNEKGNENLYFQLFYYLCSVENAYFYYYFFHDSQILEKSIEIIEDYRNNFPKMDGLIKKLRKLIPEYVKNLKK